MFVFVLQRLLQVVTAMVAVAFIALVGLSLHQVGEASHLLSERFFATLELTRFGRSEVPVVAAFLCLFALIFVAINLVVDLLYVAMDPRLRADHARGI